MTGTLTKGREQTFINKRDEKSESRIQKMEKEKLVDQARSGDQEAFNELVRLHRAKAHGWAYSVTKDTFLAEDIVQEALYRAFIKIGTLIETSRFTPWLKQIVRNQAYMKVRSASYRMESSITSLTAGNESKLSPSSVDWTEIDQILYFISSSASKRSKEDNPEEHVMRLSVVEGICTLLKCLTKREKAYFEAYFFEDLPPLEIAKLFNTNKANVYNTISRSRVKVQKERLRITINQYVQRKTELGTCKRKVLLKPEI
ncbi:RNA polymerase sigma factor [Fictibacillus nanhaiensis]|uniref:RNA polymerase sigma factor n=1 Tax=Fictibacillus nanhaiensis TaxID=742169 RepID=UPI00203E3C6A|nr:RNA polymerase sigma factor [Fictibacillus nanhaiensis]MCM3733908.1 RNA polymerase sigma factor [Fictibacillus nanhaiensis]